MFLGDVSFNCIFSWYSSSTPKYTSIYFGILIRSGYYFFLYQKCVHAYEIVSMCSCVLCVCLADIEREQIVFYIAIQKASILCSSLNESKRRQTQHRLLDTSYQMGGQTEWAHTLFKYCVVKQIWYHHLCINDSHIVWQTRKPSRFFFMRLSSSEHKTKQYPAIWLFTFWLSKNYMCVCAAAKQQRWTSKLIFSFAIHCSFIHPLTHSLVHSLSTAHTYHIVCMRFILLFFVHILFQFDFIFFSRFCLLFQY